METIINAWGNEGFHSAYAVTAAACLGMFGKLLENDEKIHLRFLDFEESFSDNWSRTQIFYAYQKYYRIVFGTEEDMVFDSIKLKDILKADGTSSLSEKTEDKEILYLGFSENDIKLNMRNEVYGKKNVAEVYYYDTDFSKLYESIPKDKDVVIINCGSYSEGGTASTFIPLENVSANSEFFVKRYNVVSGPSAKCAYNVRMPYPEIYNARMSVPAETDIFKIPEVIKKINHINSTVSTNFVSDISEPEIKEMFISKSRQNIESLERKYKKVLSESHDFRSLDPKYHVSQFIDMVCSECSEVDGTFVNFKTDGKFFLPSDNVTLYDYNADVNYNKMNIISLINAMSIREITANHNNYSGGQVWAFGSSLGERYTPLTVFTGECIKNFVQFMIMSVVITNYVQNCFSADCNNDALEIMEKWAKKPKTFLSSVRSIISVSADKQIKAYKKNSMNESFSRLVLININDFISTYICGVLETLNEIDETSEQASMFTGITESIVRNIVYSVNNIWNNSAESTIEDTKSKLAYIIQDILKISQDRANFINVDISGFFYDYNKQFPSFEQWSGTESEARIYSEKIIRYTMEKSGELARRVCRN